MMRKRISVYVVQCDRPDCLQRMSSQVGLIDVLEAAHAAGWEIGHELGDRDYCKDHTSIIPGIRRIEEQQ